MPAETHNNVLHAEVTAGDIKVMGSDMGGAAGAVRGGGITLCINGGDLAQTRAIFDKLAAGGNVTQPLREEFFGLFGSLTDKYGIAWMFQQGAESAQGDA